MKVLVTYCPLRSVRTQVLAPVHFRWCWQPGPWSQTACTFPCRSPRTAATARRGGSIEHPASRLPAKTPCTGSPRHCGSAYPSPAGISNQFGLNLACVHGSECSQRWVGKYSHPRWWPESSGRRNHCAHQWGWCQELEEGGTARFREVLPQICQICLSELFLYCPLAQIRITTNLPTVNHKVH